MKGRYYIVILLTLLLASCSNDDRPNPEKLGKEIAEAQMSGKNIEVIKESLKYCQWGGFGYSGKINISVYEGSKYLYSYEKYLRPIVNSNLGLPEGSLLAYVTDLTPKGWFAGGYCQKVYKAYLQNVKTNLGQFEMTNFQNTKKILTYHQVILTQKNEIRSYGNDNYKIGEVLN
ncbi:hypothetical protein [Francisella tularensis]|uniref:hypothetical protein n=1 Tax=Francisella tularensis TaxID=263 RepID=UPI0008F51717|nr:hypothetical protein [Francisella tularensis]APA82044.1 hypothetical protein N894_0060 [Francisella tularensis subsp. novicida PA10-7858]